MLHRSTIATPVLPRIGDLDRWLNEIVSDARSFGGFEPAVTCGVPPMNAWATDDAVLVEAELPGFSLDKIELTLVGRDLTISGQREESDMADVEVLRRERPMGSFVRTLRLPVDIENEGMKATLQHGVLRVHLPKSQSNRPRRIEVRPE